MHPFVARYKQSASLESGASFEAFCEAALNFSEDLVSEITRILPDGTAVNYISKLRALREFVIENNLAFSLPEELAQLLSEACDIRAVRDISRRKLRGYFAEKRSTRTGGQINNADLKSHLEALGRDDLLAVRNLIDRLLAQK